MFHSSGLSIVPPLMVPKIFFPVCLKADILVLRNPSSVIAALVIRVARVCTGQHCRPLCFSSPVSHSPWLTSLHMEPELCNLMSFLHMTCFLPRCSLGPRLLQNYWDKSLSYPAHLSLSLPYSCLQGWGCDWFHMNTFILPQHLSTTCPRLTLTCLASTLWVGHLLGHFWSSVCFFTPLT